MEELEAHGEKRSHWAWWAFPTELCGASEPPPETCVTEARAGAARARAAWPLAPSASSSSATGRAARGDLVLPSVDHGRVVFFVAFWERLACTPAWFRDVLTRLDAPARGPAAPAR